MSPLVEALNWCPVISANFKNRLGHPNKSFRFPSPDRRIFFRKVKKKKKIPDSLVKEASTLIYKHTIL